MTYAGQLPSEFLEPSPDRQLVIGLDCEGVDLCRTGALCIMQVKIHFITLIPPEKEDIFSITIFYEGVEFYPALRSDTACLLVQKHFIFHDIVYRKIEIQKLTQ